MSMPAEQEGRIGGGTGDATAAEPVLPLPQLQPLLDPTKDAAEKSTRRAGGQLTVPTRLHVVVDMREFMSSLPSVLHQSGFKVMPATLEVGDYVLSPNMCVERKSLPDLIGSLNNGRLYHQAEAMCKHYRYPILLIEFEGDKAFGISSVQDLGREIDPRSVQSKLVLLIYAFPKLRLMWSRSMHMTAKMFADYKLAEPEPTVEVAAKVGLPPDLSADGAGVDEPYNQAGIDFLRKLPGITDKNLRRVLDTIECVADLAEMSQADMAKMLGDNRQARTLHEFLHTEFPSAVTAAGRK
jgi:DNA excision repair protein ERCC-4